MLWSTIALTRLVPLLLLLLVLVEAAKVPKPTDNPDPASDESNKAHKGSKSPSAPEPPSFGTAEDTGESEELQRVPMTVPRIVHAYRTVLHLAGGQDTKFNGRIVKRLWDLGVPKDEIQENFGHLIPNLQGHLSLLEE